jgi:uncharacterized membrane protein
MHADEIIKAALTSIFVIHCLRFKGKHAALAYFLVGGCYGFILENSGWVLGYFSHSGYMLQIEPLAPFVAVLGWTTVFYVSDLIAREIAKKIPKLKSSPFLMALIVASIAVSFDLQVDPTATALRMWEWNESLTLRFLGVPVINWVAWFWAVFPFAYFLHLLEKKREISDDMKLKWFIISVPCMLIIEFVGVVGTMFIVYPGDLLLPW